MLGERKKSFRSSSEKAASGDPNPERSRDPRPLNETAQFIYQIDLLATEGKLEEDATHAVTGAVTIRHQSDT
eukprot:scaffold34686_cov63-Phaeocystis_antarctica.AAC.2